MIYEKSLADSCVPDNWKNADALWIHKSEPRDIVSKYRRVSLPCVVSENFEPVFYARIFEHVNMNWLFHVRLHRFTKFRQWVTQLNIFVHNLAWTLDERFFVHCVGWDFRKEFYIIPHCLSKNIRLQHYLQVIFRVQKFLMLRRQFVLVFAIMSCPAKDNSGAPQGLELIPMRFFILLLILPMEFFLTRHCFLATVLYRTLCLIENSGVLQQYVERIDLWCENCKCN